MNLKPGFPETCGKTANLRSDGPALPSRRSDLAFFGGWCVIALIVAALVILVARDGIDRAFASVAQTAACGADGCPAPNDSAF